MLGLEIWQNSLVFCTKRLEVLLVLQCKGQYHCKHKPQQKAGKPGPKGLEISQQLDYSSKIMLANF